MKKPETATKEVTITKANIQPRAKSSGSSYLGTLTEEPTPQADNMKKTEEKLRDMNFKVDPEFHTKFKMTATASGLSMKDLLEECFNVWVLHKRG